MKIPNFKAMLVEIERDRGISEESLIGAITDALVSAYKKRYPQVEHVTAQITDEGEPKIFVKKIVVAKVKDKDTEIGKKEAKLELGELFEIEVTPDDFGRLAAQTAKQVIIQRIREAEKEVAFEEYVNKAGQILSGMVQNRESGGYLINLGRIETFLTFSESIPGENLRPKDRVKVLILEVKKTAKGPVVFISRSHPDMIRKLFEAEIPEIEQGILEIRAISREAGRRTKVAVFSNDKNVGAVGTCVGPMGSRIQNVTRELGPERIDIIEWSADDSAFIAHALSPAKVTKVTVDKENRTAKVILPEKEFSLAIGKEGQNVRLAAKLTGYKIDIMSEEGDKEQSAAPEGPAAAEENKEKQENKEKKKKEGKE